MRLRIMAIAVLALAGACADNSPYTPPALGGAHKVVRPAPGAALPVTVAPLPAPTPPVLPSAPARPVVPNNPIPRTYGPLPGPESFPLPGAGVRAPAQQLAGPQLFACSGTGCALYEILPGSPAAIVTTVTPS